LLIPTQEKNMPRIHFTLALVTLLSSASLTAGLASAEPPLTPERPDRSGAEPAPPSRSPTDTGNTGSSVPRHLPLPVRSVDSITPATPMPMNLPDEAKASEVKNEYAIGMAGLIIGGAVIAALVVGVLFIITRRSWSTSH
jgi:hypothetical protein